MGLVVALAWCLRAAAMLVAPLSLMRLMARLRMLAMTWAALPVRICERSSSKVTSRTQCSRFSIPLGGLGISDSGPS